MGFVKAGEDLKMQMLAALDAFAEIVMADSLEQCPVETGTLKRSARVYRGFGNAGYGARDAKGRFTRETSVVIGYGFGDEINPKTHRTADEYAEAVHEIVEAYHEPPTKAKFLEDPVFSHAAMMEPFLAANMKMGIAGAYTFGAAVEGSSALIGKNAGVRTPAALDAGDHPKGTPHD